MRAGIVHEWLVSYAGSEKVTAAIAERLPEAPIYTLVHDPRALRGTPLEGRRVVASWLDRLPLARSKHRLYLPLMPLAVESLDVGSHDVVVSSSHAVAKGVLTRADQLHVSYVHTPMRYAWDLYHEHVAAAPAALRPVAAAMLHRLRLWDFAAAQRPDVLVANSAYVAARVRKAYRREAVVIHPPVEVERFGGGGVSPGREDFYLVVSRLVPYKRVPLIVEAMSRLGRPLVVIGDGPSRGAAERVAGPTVEFLGEVGDAEVVDRMRRCRALVIAADEDFGITAVEAMAAGAPVIAYGRGGVAETVVDGETGVLFGERRVEAVVGAVERFESRSWASGAIAEAASRFSRARFIREFDTLLDREWERFRRSGLR